ncbi:MAG: glycosyltransferase [Cyclobacteriaceae bacterium]|nr:glycosyltransferase [Cyclobacteriaceae bacterium]
MRAPRFSIVVPVYNRPNEIQELLESLTHQTNKDFEVILVEDGSSITSEKVYADYASRLTIHYYYKANSGPGPSRNFGFERARGEYFVVFDSDCIIPEHYFESVEKFLNTEPLNAWGGPDRGHQKFTLVQQAMGYTMASVFTTGGIRGGKSSGFQPRSFNMGISRKVFEQTGGFKFDRLAEDIELSVRMRKQGFRIGLIPDAYVYHKRRANFSEFFNQVKNFGKGRALVGKAHAGEVKVTHWFPAFFLIGILLSVVLLPIFKGLALTGFVFYGVYLVSIFVDCCLTTKSVMVALLSVPAALVQLTGYGYGFLKEMLSR